MLSRCWIPQNLCHGAVQVQVGPDKPVRNCIESKWLTDIGKNCSDENFVRMSSILAKIVRVWEDAGRQSNVFNPLVRSVDRFSGEISSATCACSTNCSLRASVCRSDGGDDRGRGCRLDHGRGRSSACRGPKKTSFPATWAKKYHNLNKISTFVAVQSYSMVSKQGLWEKVQLVVNSPRLFPFGGARNKKRKVSWSNLSRLNVAQSVVDGVTVPDD